MMGSRTPNIWQIFRTPVEILKKLLNYYKKCLIEEVSLLHLMKCEWKKVFFSKLLCPLHEFLVIKSNLLGWVKIIFKKFGGVNNFDLMNFFQNVKSKHFHVKHYFFENWICPKPQKLNNFQFCCWVCCPEMWATTQWLIIDLCFNQFLHRVCSPARFWKSIQLLMMLMNMEGWCISPQNWSILSSLIKHITLEQQLKYWPNQDI